MRNLPAILNVQEAAVIATTLYLQDGAKASDWVIRSAPYIKAQFPLEELEDHSTEELLALGILMGILYAGRIT